MLTVTNVSRRTVTLENPSDVTEKKKRFKTHRDKAGSLSYREVEYQEYGVVTLMPGETKRLSDDWVNCPNIENSMKNSKSPILRVKRS